MLAALAAKSDEQDRRIAALEAVAGGQRRAASPLTAIRGRPPPIGEGMLGLAWLTSAIRWR